MPLKNLKKSRFRSSGRYSWPLYTIMSVLPDLLINLAVAGLPIEKYQVPTNSPNRLSLKQARGTASGMREKISLTKEQNPLGESEVAYSTL